MRGFYERAAGRARSSCVCTKKSAGRDVPAMLSRRVDADVQAAVMMTFVHARAAVTCRRRVPDRE
ncbi:MAG TPA: hypothetical protein VNS22_17120 [Geminicoccus sp.]|uniref:hypothetical protein n=1 Tax=Geminicoccus sp. TaxID=2024832 RepID=UPI002BF0B69A|nr:hypothetical protein [Geminicoccus sp.]HWL70089.1 hypothetical protein [Geminicoccus sp.]